MALRGLLLPLKQAKLLFAPISEFRVELTALEKFFIDIRSFLLFETKALATVLGLVLGLLILVLGLADLAEPEITLVLDNKVQLLFKFSMFSLIVVLVEKHPFVLTVEGRDEGMGCVFV